MPAKHAVSEGFLAAGNRQEQDGNAERKESVSEIFHFLIRRAKYIRSTRSSAG